MALVVTDTLQVEIDRILSSPNAFEVLKLTVTNCTKEKVASQFNAIMEPFLRASRDVKAMQVREKLKMAKNTLLDDKLRSKEAAKAHEKVTIAWHERQQLEAIEQRTKTLETRAANILAAMEAAASAVAKNHRDVTAAADASVQDGVTQGT